MKRVYDAEIVKPEADSLEAVMSQIYTDLFNPALERRARRAFRALIQLLNRRLAETTNDLDPSGRVVSTPRS